MTAAARQEERRQAEVLLKFLLDIDRKEMTQKGTGHCYPVNGGEAFPHAGEMYAKSPHVKTDEEMIASRRRWSSGRAGRGCVLQSFLWMEVRATPLSTVVGIGDLRQPMSSCRCRPCRVVGLVPHLQDPP